MKNLINGLDSRYFGDHMKNRLLIDGMELFVGYVIDGEGNLKNGLYEYEDGAKYWYAQGRLHREDGPAIEYPGSNKYWYSRGQFHRTDGTAIERSNGTSEWYYNGKRIECSNQKEFERLIKVKAFW